MEKEQNRRNEKMKKKLKQKTKTKVKVKSNAENSLSSKLGKVPNESENVAIFRRSGLEGKFVSKNVINLSRRNLSSAEISLLSKGLKFAPTANKIDQAKLKRELEEYGRKVRLMWLFT